MQTRLTDAWRDTPQGQEADRVLRHCVHCGFCNATCPTYQLLGDELDGPRGRIYQIKQLLEGAPATASLRTHLDRCLTCRACETTCPSGVDYHRLLDIGREAVERQMTRPPPQRLLRWLLRTLLPYRRRVTPLVRLAQAARPLLPPALKRRIPPRARTNAPAPAAGGRFLILLEGCVQPALAPQINAATVRVLHRLGIGVKTAPAAGCCGALPHHLGATDRARALARANIDAWWPLVEQGAEAIVIDASGCAPMVKDYGHLLDDDPRYADRARHIAHLARDISEVLRDCDLGPLPRGDGRRIAFHSPCTLQHGQRLAGVVEGLLESLGYDLVPVRDPHLCCGSAGTYSITQPNLSRRLLEDKLDALQQHQPELLATANIGCLLHLQTGARTEVRHWVELVAE